RALPEYPGRLQRALWDVDDVHHARSFHRLLFTWRHHGHLERADRRARVGGRRAGSPGASVHPATALVAARAGAGRPVERAAVTRRRELGGPRRDARALSLRRAVSVCLRPLLDRAAPAGYRARRSGRPLFPLSVARRT